MGILAQLEITTHCNLSCYYCVGRHVPQKHMSVPMFNKCIDMLQGHELINLQGEGEPFLHPNIEEMLEICKNKNFSVYTITNGTVRKSDDFIRKFKFLHVTIDTLDDETAKKIGRGHIDKIVDNVLHWKTLVPITVISIGGVDNTVLEWTRKEQIPIVRNPLEKKNDYSILYTDKVEKTKPHINGPKTCRFLEQPIMRFFDVNGTELPCCFIKHPDQYPGRLPATELLKNDKVPRSCVGCNFIKPSRLKK